MRTLNKKCHCKMTMPPNWCFKLWIQDQMPFWNQGVTHADTSYKRRPSYLNVCKFTYVVYIHIVQCERKLPKEETLECSESVPSTKRLTSFRAKLLRIIGSSIKMSPGIATTIRIHLHIFSGMPDPEWVIQPSNSNFESILNGVNGHNSTNLGNHLGYSGFTITIYRDVVGIRHVQRFDVGNSTRKPFETLLLDTVCDLIPEGDFEPFSPFIIQGIRNELQI